MKDMIRKYILVSVFMMAVSMAIGQYDFSINGKSILNLQNESSAPLKITLPIFHAMPLLEDDPQRVDFPGLEQQLLAPYNIDEIPFFCRLDGGCYSGMSIGPLHCASPAMARHQ